MFRLVNVQNSPLKILKLYHFPSHFSILRRGLKVTICGAAGHCGQATALLLKMCPFIDELALYDIESTKGIARDLNLIDANCKAVPYSGKPCDALKDARVVTVLACAPSSIKDSKEKLQSNGKIIYDLVNAYAKYCPQAILAIATQPLNSIIPIAAETLKKRGVYNPAHLFGMTCPDTMRANSLVAEYQGLPSGRVYVPVIGGSSKYTRIPLLSHAKPPTEFSNREILAITKSVQNASDDIPPTSKTHCFRNYLSSSSAFAQFITSIVRALKGDGNVIETALVPYCDYPNTGYFAIPIELGIDGLQRCFGIPQLSEYEYCLFLNAIEQLKKDVEEGVKFICPDTPKTDFC